MDDVGEAYEAGDGDGSVKKRGRVKVIYGVKQRKWNSSKIPPDSLDALKMAGSIADFTEREEVFEQNRAGLMKLIRFFTSLTFKE